MMKAMLFALFVFSFSLWGAEPKVVIFDKLQKRGTVGSQLIYIPNQDSPFTGKAIGLFENGQKRVETNYRDGKLEGLFRWWYENGKKKAERNYKAGKLDGVLTSWHMNGQVGSIMNYQEGKPDGLVTMWYKNGQKMSESNFKDGKPDGIVTGWYINGQKKWEGNWKEGKTVSAKSWKPNGEKCPATNVKDGNGVGVQYKDDGTEESRYTFKDGEPFEEERRSEKKLAWIRAKEKLESQMATDKLNEELSRKRMDEGERVDLPRKSLEDLLNDIDQLGKEDSVDGEKAIDLSKLQDRDGVKYLPNEETPFTGRACWYKNGQKRSEGNFKDGKMDGLWITWSDGRKWGKGLHKAGEANFKDGKKHGLENHIWYPYYNGQKMWEANYKDGMKDGTFIGWDKEGLKLVEENYKDGKPDGLWIKYKSDGTERSRETYKDGELVSNENKPDVVKLSPQDVFGGKFHEVKRKLENGADPEAILLPKGKRTALHCCCMGGRVNIVKLLLDGGASPNALDKYNMTPLDILFSPDYEGRAPLERMSAENQLEIQRMLEKAGGKRNRLPSKELFKGKYINDTAPKKDAIETAVDWSKLQDREGVMYLPNEETPFTGRAERFYENGQKEMEWNYKDGIKEGLVNGWYESGQKAGEANYKDGKNDGLSTSWYKNGEKRIEQTCKDGKTMSAKAWKPNGEKCPVTNLKDGNGVWVVYDEAGTEWFRDTFKDGLKVERLTP